MKTAVVFDSAGTLLGVYRVAKDVKKGTLEENIVSTNMIPETGCNALVALKSDCIEPIEVEDPGMRISEFLGKSKMGMDVICRGKKCTLTRIREAAQKDDTATIGDVQEAIAAVKLKCKDIYYVNIGLVVDVAAGSISYVLATGGRAFTGARETVADLMKDGVDVFIASGDSRRPLDALARDFGIQASNVYDAVSPTGKKEIVDRLKKEYDCVTMVGDGVNDRLAFESADVAILTEQQKSIRSRELHDVVDFTIDDIRKVKEVVRESLHKINR